jgi:hypothetical protein
MRRTEALWNGRVPHLLVVILLVIVILTIFVFVVVVIVIVVLAVTILVTDGGHVHTDGAWDCWQKVLKLEGFC